MAGLRWAYIYARSTFVLGLPLGFEDGAAELHVFWRTVLFAPTRKPDWRLGEWVWEYV
jgi:hypothetical protein